MKILLTAYLALLGILGDNAQAQTTDPADYLSAEMKMTGEEGGSEPALRKLRLLAADQQVSIVEALIRKVQGISSGPAVASPESGTYIRVAAGILYQIGTDEQIIKAFGALSNFGHAEPDAAKILALCEGSGGVEIIQKLAEKRLPELESAINPKNEEEKARSNDIVIPFYTLVLRLDGARNPQGPLAAKKLRDQVAARYVSENGKFLVALLDKDMAKARSRTKKDRSNSEPLPSKTNSDSPKAPETDSSNVHKQVQPQSQEKPDFPAPYKVVAMIAIILAGTALAWRFMKKPDL